MPSAGHHTALRPDMHTLCAAGEKSCLKLRQCGLSSATLLLQPTDGRAKKKRKKSLSDNSRWQLNHNSMNISKFTFLHEKTGKRVILQWMYKWTKELLNPSPQSCWELNTGRQPPASRGAAHDVCCLATQTCHQRTPFYQSRRTQTQLIISFEADCECRTLTATLQLHIKTIYLVNFHYFI